jgi:hypothetical protein
VTYRLVQGSEDAEAVLREVTSYAEGRIAIDTEGSSLNTRTSRLAGVSIAWNDGEAAYFPTGHRVGSNVPTELVVRSLKRIEETGARFEMWNAKFDLNILQVGLKWAPAKFLDGIELIYLDNPDRNRKGLKIAAKEDLGVDMDVFESLFTPEELKRREIDGLDISTKTPLRCLDYACADADYTRQMVTKYGHIEKEFEFAVQVDTQLVEIVRRMEHNGGLEIDHEYVEARIKELDARIIAVRDMIWRMAGYQFELGSPKQVGSALFDRMRIPSPGLTGGKNPQHRTDADSLEKLAPQFPVIERVLLWRSLVLARNNYFGKLKAQHDTGLPPRFSFNIYAAPTFRFAAPGAKNSGGTGLNIQAVSKGDAPSMEAADLSINRDDTNYAKNLEAEELLTDPAELAEEFAALTEAANANQTEWADPATLPWVVPTEAKGLACFRESCTGCPARCADRGIDTTRRKTPGLILLPSTSTSWRRATHLASRSRTTPSYRRGRHTGNATPGKR